MTEKAPEPHLEEDEELDGKLNYKPPPQKSLKELQEMDKDDESLAKYKKTLLGDGPVVADPTAPNVTVTRLTLVCESAPGPITMDLTGDLEALKKEIFVLKEGVEYRVKINFKVNRDIVSGLKYVQHTYRTGVKGRSERWKADGSTCKVPFYLKVSNSIPQKCETIMCSG
ncbi:rho GDP-dissociation inhibitor 2 isoform X3 [Pseudorca crassidens]|uniref:rho GDP-dissociation inhibitor 2 isoform X3 n=1 Tax=Pseudorca crassidens TaxID=82174 RepID=UPI00352D8E5D